MKTNIICHSTNRFVCYLVLLLVSGLSARGQQKQILAHGYSSEPGLTQKSHWRLKTSATSLSTRVEFYDDKGEQLYEETLEGHYLKLTNRTQRELDRLLQELMSGQLLSTRVKAQPLPIRDLPTDANARSASQLQLQLVNPQASIASPVYLCLNQSGSVYIHIENPQRQQTTVWLTDGGTRYYEDNFRDASYYKFLDVSALAGGSYYIKVRRKGLQETYQLNLSPKQCAYQRQPQLISQTYIP